MENRDIGRLLRLKVPWKVIDVRMSGDLKRVDIELGVEHDRMVGCPSCGTMCSVHDRVRRTWRHLDIMDAECYITADIPRTRCEKCGILRIKTSWADEFVSYTNMFEKKTLGLLRSMPISRAAMEMRIGYGVVEGMMDRFVHKALDMMDLSSVRNIMLDETSSKRGHRYITIITDADTGRIIFMCKGKGADSIGEFRKWLVEHNGDPRNVRMVSCDLSRSFLSGLDKHFKRMRIVYDRFHLVQMANTALDEVRSKNQVNGQRDKKLRFTLLRNSGRLSEDDRKRVFDVKNDNVVLGKAYEMKESLLQLYDYPDRMSATEHLRQWLKWVFAEGTDRMKRLGNTVAKHFSKILNWFRSRMSNGFLEGLNGMIQSTKRIGRGYPNTDNFIRIIYFRHGRLDV